MEFVFSANVEKRKRKRKTINEREKEKERERERERERMSERKKRLMGPQMPLLTLLVMPARQN